MNKIASANRAKIIQALCSTNHTGVVYLRGGVRRYRQWTDVDEVFKQESFFWYYYFFPNLLILPFTLLSLFFLFLFFVPISFCSHSSFTLFRYATGVDIPSAHVFIPISSTPSSSPSSTLTPVLYIPKYEPDHTVWHGPTPTLDQFSSKYGIQVQWIQNESTLSNQIEHYLNVLGTESKVFCLDTGYDLNEILVHGKKDSISSRINDTILRG